MKDKLLKWLSGALGQQGSVDIPQEEQYFPEGGIVRVPDFFEMPANPHGEVYMGPECKVLIASGAYMSAGQVIAEIDTPSHVFEVVAPCDGTIEEIYVSSGQLVEAGQEICKLNES